MVVITPEYIHPNEVNLLNEMLNRGLPLLHVRKPNFTFEQLQYWIDNISYQHLNRLVIHIPSPIINNNAEVFKQYIELINSLKTQYAHLSTSNCSFVNNYPLKTAYLSTSVHNPTEYHKLSTYHKRVFLSPVFASISKTAYYPTTNWKVEIDQWNYPSIQPIALGGIAPENLKQVHDMGFSDFALLGALWQAQEPLKNFDLCYKQDQLLFQ